MAQYQEPSFNLYVELAVISAKAIADEVDDFGVLAENGDRRRLALSVAASVFLSDESARPVHLSRLFEKLRYFKVSAEQGAEFCLSVEAIRMVSGRTAISPLLDKRCPDNRILKVMRANVADDAVPFVERWAIYPDGNSSDPTWRDRMANILGTPGDYERVDVIGGMRHHLEQCALPLSADGRIEILHDLFGLTTRSADLI